MNSFERLSGGPAPPHSRWTHAGGTLELVVRDNGRGFPSSGGAPGGAPNGLTPSLGLLGIRDRAILLGGRASITSTPGDGATIVVTLPLATPRESAGRGRVVRDHEATTSFPTVPGGTASSGPDSLLQQ